MGVFTQYFSIIKILDLNSTTYDFIITSPQVYHKIELTNLFIKPTNDENFQIGDDMFPPVCIFIFCL